MSIAVIVLGSLLASFGAVSGSAEQGDLSPGEQIALPEAQVFALLREADLPDVSSSGYAIDHSDVEGWNPDICC
ncbi:hypothetical protein ADILRU_1366 [Leifsonia rubra CMS 76R]|nr:hypothetical protein ADILRU_1366 [Leifsonia rubra CMS 76R]